MTPARLTRRLARWRRGLADAVEWVAIWTLYLWFLLQAPSADRFHVWLKRRQGWDGHDDGAGVPR